MNIVFININLMRVKMYPYRVYVDGSRYFNNYFIFNHYLNEYKNDKTFLYSTKPSIIDIMTILYATDNNLCHLSCNLQKGYDRYKNMSVVNFKISETTDMLVLFVDESDKTFDGLKDAFYKRRKPVYIIDISGADTIIPGATGKHENATTVDFNTLYSPYVDKTFEGRTYTERAMKFLIDAYRNKELMKLIIDNKDNELVASDKLGESVRALLYWIYENQFSTLVEDYQNIYEKDIKAPNKRFSTREYRHAAPCEWNKSGESVEVYTGTGLLLSKGYSRVIEHFDKTYLEINDLDICKNHIHKSLKSRFMTEDEDDCVKVSYRTSDVESYPLTYQVANFSDSVFKMGFWYISTDFVTTVKPEEKEKVVVEETEEKDVE